jgi:A/G-specific adenine glycosylase
MLHQTQAAVVAQRFPVFLRQFPDVVSLAHADEQDVLRAWEGLGYYRRARQLHETAQRIVREHQGTFPTDARVLQSLPGLGRYTANAILSQAFDRRLPILETNSERVLRRVFARPGDLLARRWLWQCAEDLLPQRGAGEFNQALMELGALVCTPKSPQCANCPLRACCAARRLGVVEQTPSPLPKPKSSEVHEVGVVIERDGRVLVLRRPQFGRWAGLWEFPHSALEPSESEPEAVVRIARTWTGLIVAPLAHVATIRHAVTHHRIQLACWTALRCSGRLRTPLHVESRWVAPRELDRLPLSSPQRRVARLISR